MKNEEGYELTKKDLILRVTIDLIKSEGFEGVTVRKIASLADVNVGLVNYHFGSKDKLLNSVIGILVTSFKESFAVLDDEGIPPRERLKCFLVQYIAFSEEYPFIVRRLVNNEPIMFDSQMQFVNFVKAIGLKKVQRTIEELTGESDPERLIIMLSHLLGAVLLPTLIEALFEKVTGLPFPEVETRIDIMLDRYFPEK